MTELGKAMIAFGALIAVIGAVLVFSGKLHLPLGRLPGDFTLHPGKNITIYFPLTTSILISVALTLIYWLIRRFR